MLVRWGPLPPAPQDELDPPRPPRQGRGMGTGLQNGDRELVQDMGTGTPMWVREGGAPLWGSQYGDGDLLGGREMGTPIMGMGGLVQDEDEGS